MYEDGLSNLGFEKYLWDINKRKCFDKVVERKGGCRNEFINNQLERCFY